MILVLAEKPSAMRNFAKALGGDEGSYNGEKLQALRFAWPYPWSEVPGTTSAERKAR